MDQRILYAFVLLDQAENDGIDCLINKFREKDPLKREMLEKIYDEKEKEQKRLLKRLLKLMKTWQE